MDILNTQEENKQKFTNAVEQAYKSTVYRTQTYLDNLLTNLYDNKAKPYISINYFIQTGRDLLTVEDDTIVLLSQLQKSNRYVDSVDRHENQVRGYIVKHNLLSNGYEVVLCYEENFFWLYTLDDAFGNPEMTTIYVYAVFQTEHVPDIVRFYLEQFYTFLRNDNIRLNKGDLSLDTVYSQAIYKYEKFVNQDIISIPFSIVSLLSSEFYETKIGKGSICVIRDMIDCDIMFDVPIPFDSQNIRKLRKLIEIANNNFALIVCERKAIGISRLCEMQDFQLFSITGHMQWQFLSHGSLEFHYNHGVYKAQAEENYAVLLSNTIDKYYNISSEHKKNILKLIKSVKNKGTILVLGEEQDVVNETNRLCSLDRGIKVSKLQMLSIPNISSSMASIDGAIFVDLECHCHAIGVILDGEAVSMGNSSRGARYNSGRNYGIWKNSDRPFIIVIISEDGSIDIYPDCNN